MKKLLLTGLVATTAMAGFAVSPAQAEKLPGYEDDTLVTLSGAAQQVSDDSFMLNYGENTIQVNFNEWDMTSEFDLRTTMAEGDQVTVYGEFDKNWFTNNEIDAQSLYIRDQGDYYYINEDADLDDRINYPNWDFSMGFWPTMENGAFTYARGTVVEAGPAEIRLDTKAGHIITVDMEDMGYSAFDEQNLLEVGDNVMVFGEVDIDFFEKMELDAEGIVRMNTMNKVTSN